MVIHSGGNVAAHLPTIRQLKNLGMLVRGIKDKEQAMTESARSTQASCDASEHTLGSFASVRR
jgi:hypothetical protein